MKKIFVWKRTKPANYVLLLLFFAFYSCNDVETKTITNSLLVENSKVDFGSGASSRELNIETDLISELAVSVSPDDTWCTATVRNDVLQISVADNALKKNRMTVVTVAAKHLKQDVLVTQKAYGFFKDKSVKVSNATATSFAEGFEPEKMLDENASTYFNSKFGAITEWPFYLDFYFEEVDKIDYLIHTPRQDSGNKWGAIGQFELWVATETNPTLTKYGDYDFKQTLLVSSTIEFTGGLEKPTHIQFRILSGYEDRISCALMQFFAKESVEPYDHLQVFTDHSCAEIKAGLTADDLNKIPDLFYKELALDIFNKVYDAEFRIQEYRPYQHPDIMAEVNKTSAYSLKDNATGIYVENPGDQLILFVGDLKGQTPTLNIRDYQNNKEATYALNEGLNVLYPSIAGLAYIYNHTTDEIPLCLNTNAEKDKAAQKTIRINIVTGTINGYFDIQKHTAADWTRILTNHGKHTEIDVLGKHSHVVWRTSDYHSYNTDIVLMTNYIDNLVDQQKEFMGLYYHHKSFNNRMFMHVDYAAGAAYSTSYRTGYNLLYTNVFCSEAGFRTRLWVLGHEVGHTNQVRPGVKWGGTTETTNNLYAMYNQQQILGEATRLTPELNNDKQNNYDVSFELIITGKQPWVLPDNYDRYITKVAPFWQLKLYFVDILKQAHFYHDLFEHYRTTPDLNQSALGDDYHGMLQLDFVRQVCNTGKINLLEFFEEWGFLRPVDVVVNDYGNKTLKINQAQIDALKEEINAKNYPNPTITVQDLTDTNYRQYIQ